MSLCQRGGGGKFFRKTKVGGRQSRLNSPPWLWWGRALLLCRRMWYNWLSGEGLFAGIEQMCYTGPMATNSDLRVRFELPLPPGINQQYATVNGRRILSKSSRRYKKQVSRIIQGLRAGGIVSDDLVAALQEGFVGLFIDFYFETPHRRDLDGGLKITQDAICQALGVNDNRVVDVHLVKRIDPLRPHIEVELEAILDWQFDIEYIYLGEERWPVHKRRKPAGGGDEQR
jgi:crossover junction endodeoxyribonuclease RusA